MLDLTTTISEAGWGDGSYDFKLQLNLDNKPYANSLVKHFTASESARSGAMGISPYVIGGIVAAALLVAIIAFLVFRRINRGY